ncbi:hypothetical protein HUT18_18130 [Streptomyces sp. NA04227]|nr:hypothetical protein HUT18_18130 [Streptomyces sp. NA04227]
MGPAKRHLASWGTGSALPRPEGATGSATVVLESPAHLDQLLASDLAGPGTLVLVPGDQEAEGQDPAAAPLVLGYQGSLVEPGDEMSLGDAFFLQTQDYATSQYMSVIGPTLIRITEPGDFEAFLADADAAHDKGEFPAHVSEPVVRLADLSALGAGTGADGPRTRLYVNADGQVSTAPGGIPLGGLDSGLDALDAQWRDLNSRSLQPCSVALSAAVPDEDRTAQLTARPWLGRYLAVLDALRELRTRGVTGLKVSGFGGRLDPALDEVTVPADTDRALPLLLWSEDKAYVHVAETGRFFQLDLRAAKVAEALLVHGEPGAAAAHAAPAALQQVQAFFGTAGVRLTADRSGDGA